MEQESGFIIEPELDGQDAAPQLLHRSDAGFSEVWRVTKFSQFVVLKALKPEYRGNPVYETLLRKEFEIGYSLNHPSVCRTWHFRHHPQLGNCIEMEWIDGATLEERFRDVRPDEGLFRKIAGELCDAVAYLHSRQVIHRDIKPSNILITHNGDNVKLIDFGLADSDDSAVLKMAVGTERYIAPEILAGKQADVRTDIWGVGRVLSVFTGAHRGALRKATALRPEDRYPNMAAFKEALFERTARAWIYVAVAFASLLFIGFALWNRQGREGAGTGVKETSAEVTGVVSENAGATGVSAPAAGTVSSADSLQAPSPALRPSARSAASGKPAAENNPSARNKPANANKPAAKGNPAAEGQASREEVDDLFRRATEVFE